jgi:hypothetical protein
MDYVQAGLPFEASLPLLAAAPVKGFKKVHAPMTMNLHMSCWIKQTLATIIRNNNNNGSWRTGLAGPPLPRYNEIHTAIFIFVPQYTAVTMCETEHHTKRTSGTQQSDMLNYLQRPSPLSLYSAPTPPAPLFLPTPSPSFCSPLPSSPHFSSLPVSPNPPLVLTSLLSPPALIQRTSTSSSSPQSETPSRFLLASLPVRSDSVYEHK